MSHKVRVIALVDMDCFYCQVEEKLNPTLRGKPVAVVQYNLWRDGGIIAANYQAKEKGVTKGMWMHEAKNLCPEIEFARVAELRGRADLTKYREAGNEVALVLSSFANVIERASVDEAYLDITESVKAELAKGISNVPLEKLNTTHVVGCSTSDFISNITLNQDTDGFCEDDLLLAVGGVIVERIRSTVLEKTGYKCSAGIAHNKILAKLVCGLHKPNKQTILPQNAIVQYFADLPIKKIKRLGGKFGKKIAEELKILYVGDLLNYSEKELVNKFDMKTGRWLYNIARGIDHDPVSPKLISKSISCCKRFPGKNALFKHTDVEHWTNELCLEISERLQKDQEENNRTAKMITISFTQEINKTDTSTSKTISLKTYDAKKIAHEAFGIIKNSCIKPNSSCHVKYLGISAGNFDGNIKKLKSIEYYLGKNKKLSSETELFSKIRTNSLNEEKIEKQKSDEIFSEQLDLENETSDIEKTKLREYQDILEFKTSQKNNISNLNNPLQNCHESKSQMDADMLPESNAYANEKVASAAEVENAVSARFGCNLSDSKDFDMKNDNFLKNSSELYSAIDEDNKIGNSFFARYFENVDSSSSDNSAYPPERGDEIQSDITSSCNQIVKCEECSQSILQNEINSHRDYHFAINLSKEDVISTNASSSSSHNIPEDKTFDKSRQKRKTVQSSIAILDAFLEKTELDSKICTEMCSKCNKKIKLTEWEYHSDYHIAKELYKELNCTNNSLNFKKSKNIKSLGGDISQYLRRKSS